MDSGKIFYGIWKWVTNKSAKLVKTTPSCLFNKMKVRESNYDTNRMNLKSLYKYRYG